MQAERENLQGGITVLEIQQILERYNIGKKPLARLLGWGEVTIIRYLNGDEPSRAYSDKLMELYKSPRAYYELLNQNKDQITFVACEKSKSAIYKCILQSKILVAAYYLKSKWEGYLPTEGYRCLLYYVQGFSLALNKTPFFPEEYLILPSAIPYEQVLEILSDDLYIPEEMLETVLSKKELDLLNGIVKAFMWYGHVTLKTIMVEENNELKISRNKNNERIVSLDTLQKHFQWILKEYRILKADDIWKYIDSRFAETRKWKTIMTW